MLANQELEALANSLGAQVGDYSLIFPARLGRGNGEACYVYFIGGECGPVKIGKSNYPERRLVGLQTSSPVKLKILALREGSHPLERFYHKTFAQYRLYGEWFERSAEIEEEIASLQLSEAQLTASRRSADK